MTKLGFTEARNLLGVSAEFDDNELKLRYRIMARLHHPDHGGDTEVFKEIQKAYDTLKNMKTRDISARNIEDQIFDVMWDDWYDNLSEEEKEIVNKAIESENE